MGKRTAFFFFFFKLATTWPAVCFREDCLPLADAAAGKSGYVPVTIFILAPGAFLVLAGLTALQNKVKNNAKKKGKKVVETAGCGEGCASCGNSACNGKVFPTGNEKE